MRLSTDGNIKDNLMNYSYIFADGSKAVAERANGSGLVIDGRYWSSVGTSQMIYLKLTR